MEQYFEIIKQSPLFADIEVSEYKSMLACMQGRVQHYQKNEVLLLAGSPVETVGIVLSGVVRVIREDLEGKQNLLTELQVGELFGEVFVCANVQHSPVTVLATSSVEVLRFNYRRVITTCSSACAFHRRLIENMLTPLAEKNLMLNQKLEIISKRTTRERLMLFFRYCSAERKSFTIPYSHEELAAYLCVERSAMSAELSRMQRDGLIRYTRKQFELL